MKRLLKRALVGTAIALALTLPSAAQVATRLQPQPPQPRRRSSRSKRHRPSTRHRHRTCRFQCRSPSGEVLMPFHVRDVAGMAGTNSNPLIGYGLVVGLQDG